VARKTIKGLRRKRVNKIKIFKLIIEEEFMKRALDLVGKER